MDILLNIGLAALILTVLVQLFVYFDRVRIRKKYTTHEAAKKFIIERMKNNPFIKAHDRTDIDAINRASHLHWGFVGLQLITLTNLINNCIDGHIYWGTYISLITVPVLAYFQANIIASHGFAIETLRKEYAEADIRS